MRLQQGQETKAQLNETAAIVLLDVTLLCDAATDSLAEMKRLQRVQRTQQTAIHSAQEELPSLDENNKKKRRCFSPGSA